MFSRAGIYALPARYEPFGLSVLEAAMAGCALVLGDIPSLRENWSGAAVFVPPNDVVGLATALQRLTADAELRTRLSTAARDRASRFSIDEMTRAYLECYSDARAQVAA
jgi:glycosyltransferase involved in cell wall biosynthesis